MYLQKIISRKIKKKNTFLLASWRSVTEIGGSGSRLVIPAFQTQSAEDFSSSSFIIRSGSTPDLIFWMPDPVFFASQIWIHNTIVIDPWCFSEVRIWFFECRIRFFLLYNTNTNDLILRRSVPESCLQLWSPRMTTSRFTPRKLPNHSRKKW